MCTVSNSANSYNTDRLDRGVFLDSMSIVSKWFLPVILYNRLSRRARPEFINQDASQDEI